MTNEIRVLDLFSGIGGFALGLRRAGGFRTVGYCEIDPYCRQVLQQRMRDGALDSAPICTDVTKLDGEPWRGRVDLICGGFPCQDISSSNVNGLGLDGAKSGLWREMARLVAEIRPKYLLVENVSNLLMRGLGRVLGDLARLGYDAEWDNIPVALFGAPNRRERIWILAYPEGRGLSRCFACCGEAPSGDGQPWNNQEWGEEGTDATGLTPRDLPGWRLPGIPPVCGVVNGLPGRVGEIHAVGNAVSPQVVEWLGRRIRSHAS